MPGEFALSLVFCISGAAGLIFEVVWFHRCGLVLGNSIWSTSIVLSSFMGGLALGGALIARYGNRIGRFLRLYAALEVLVAVTGVGLTYGLPGLPGLLAPVTRPALETPWLINLVRLVTAFSVLIVPATAMGATLPVLVGALCQGRSGLGRALGRLYGWNTLGAVLGVVSAEVVLIARVGVTGAAWVAALLNFGAAAVALWLSRRADMRQPIAGPVASTSSALQPAASRLLVCAFLAGASLMALEVVWFRFLSLFITSNTLAASLMLAVVLAGIGVGGLAASSWLRRRPHAATYLPTMAFATGGTLAASYVTFQFLTEGSLVTEWSHIIVFACALAFPTSLLSGVLFTLLGGALEREIGVETRTAGWLMLANAIGAMCGPLVATFAMLPALGMERSLFALALLYGVIGLLALRNTVPAPARQPRRIFGVVTLAAVLVLALFPFGLMATTYFPRAARPYTSIGETVIATREGPTETIFLTQWSWMRVPIFHRLVTNGFTMSGTMLHAKRYMRYFVYWPMLLHKAPLRRALVICYGVGLTAGAVTDLESVESIDVVEISRDVLQMSDVMYAPDVHPLHDRRVRLHLEDGRYFLQTTDERFDLITGEPPPPHAPGTVNLYTREYFRLVYDRLAEGGIATYWLPVARPEPEEMNVNAIIRAFCDVFEDCSLWNGTPFDWMLVGTRHATGPVSQTQFSKAWDPGPLGDRLREIGFEVPQQIGATFLGDVDYLKQLTATTLPLTDDFPRRLRSPYAGLPPSDPRKGDYYREIIDPDRARRAFEASRFIRHLWPERLIRETLPFFDHQGIINRTIFFGAASPLPQIEDLHFLLTQTTLRQLPLWLLGLGNHPSGPRLADLHSDEPDAVDHELGLHALAERDYPGAVAHLARSTQRGVAGAQPLLAYALCLAGRLDAAGEVARNARPRTQDEVDFWRWLGATFGVGANAVPAGPGEEQRSPSRPNP